MVIDIYIYASLTYTVQSIHGRNQYTCIFVAMFCENTLKNNVKCHILITSLIDCKTCMMKGGYKYTCL